MNNSYCNYLNPINNSRFLNSSHQYLNTNIDERKIVLIIFELMNYIHNSFALDYIIQGDITIDKEDVININRIAIFNNNEFNEANISLHKNKNAVPIRDTYVKYPKFQISKISDFSRNQVLKGNGNELKNGSILSSAKYSFQETMSFSSFELDSYKKIDLNPLGLKNPSIYCYMNCCLQLLLSIPELNYYFLYKRYKQDPNHKTLISDDFSEFIHLYQYYINRHEIQMDLPPSMFGICNLLVPRGVMNDCEEFLILLIKSVQEELNHIKNKSSENKNSYDYNGDDSDKNIQKRWSSYRVLNSSFADSIFTGYTASSVICNKCNKTSYNYEPFMDLSIPIPKSDKSINKCLDIYFETEFIDCDYHCDRCNNITNVSM